MILIIPPVVPPPYRVVPVPGVISTAPIESIGIASKGIVPIDSSRGFIGTPFNITFTRLIVLSPLPLKSTIGPKAVLCTTATGASSKIETTLG